MAETLFTDIIDNLGKTVKKIKGDKPGKFFIEPYFNPDGSRKIVGGYGSEDRAAFIEKDKSGTKGTIQYGNDDTNKKFRLTSDGENTKGEIVFKFADGGSTNGSADAAFSAKVNELMDDGYDFGEAVKEAMRQGYNKGGQVKKGTKTNLTEEKFVQLRVQKKNLNHKEFAEYLNTQTEYYPDPKQADKFSGLTIDRRYNKAKSKGKFPPNFTFKGSTQDRAITDADRNAYKEYAKEKFKRNPAKVKEILALDDKSINRKLSDNRKFKKLDPDVKAANAAKQVKDRAKLKAKGGDAYQRYLQIARENNRLNPNRNANKFYRNLSDPKSLLWEDLLKRNEEGKSKFFSYDKKLPKKSNSGFYDKAKTQSIVLKDKKGNKFRYNTLLDDIDKAGYDSRAAFKPYDQKSFLYKSGLMPELNKSAGIQLGSRRNPFHVHHIEGVKKNPFNVMLTYEGANISEGRSKKSLQSAFARISQKEKLNPNNPKLYTDKKNALKKFYQSLDPDIAVKIGKQEIGKRPRLIEMLKKSKVPMSKAQRSGAMSLGSFPAQLGEIDSTGFLSKIKNNITDVDYSKMQLGKGNVAKFAGIAKNAAKVAGKVLGVAALPLEAYFMKQMYDEGKTMAEILASPFFLNNMVGETQDLLKMEPVERQAIKNEQIAEDFSMMDSDFYTPPLKGVEAVNTQMVKDRVAQERALEEEKRKNLRNKTLPNEGLLRILSNPTYEGVL